MKPALDLPRFARFRVVRELGRGAQGAVHEAIDLERDARVALKTLRRVGPDEIVRLKTEFRAVRDLRHPNLVRLGELIEDEGRWFFTMEAIDGVDFLTYVRGEAVRDESTSWPTRVESGAQPRVASLAHREPPVVEPARVAPAAFDEARVRGAFAELALALTFLHRAGKVHRDLKPSNVLVEREGRVVLIDFGVVAEFAAHAGEEGGAIVGTVPYMAPEQVLGEAVGPEADWYAAGVLLFEALTGRRPFDGEARDVMERKCVLDPPRASEVTPGLPADLDALVNQLLAREPAQRATDEDVLRVLGLDAPGALDRGHPSRAPFVGRKTELAALGRAFDDLRHGALISVFLEGESGIGKTALARRFVEDAREGDRQVVVLEGRCHEQERVPYNAFDAVIDGLARYLQKRNAKRHLDWLPPGMERLQRLFPSLGVIDEGAPPPSSGVTTSRDERLEAFAVLRELFVRVGARRPLVVLVEDLQWADADSLALLDALSHGVRVPCMLLVATSRLKDDGDPCDAVRVLGGDVRRLPIGALREEDAQDLVVRLTGGRGTPSGLESLAIAANGHGHPLFIEELVRYLEEPGARSRTLDDALTARAARLDADTRHVLQVIAAADAPTAQSVIAAAAGISFADYSARARVLREAKLVRLRGERQEDPVEPYHDRVREAVYAALSPAERVPLHTALAEALEARGAGAELLARHFDAANDEIRAAHYATLAAQAAARALAFDRAAALYERALARYRGSPEGRRHLLIALAESLADAGRAKGAGETLLEAARTGELPPPEHNELLRRAAELLLASGNIAMGIDATRVVLREHGLSLPTSHLVALARLAWYQMRTDLRPLTWSVRRPADVPPEVAARLDVCWSLGGALGLIDSVRSMLFLFLGAHDALSHGDEARIARALAAAASGQAGLGRRAAATRLGDACRRAAASEGSDRSRFYAALATLTHRFFLDNDWRACIEETREATRLWQVRGRTDGWEVDFVDQFECWSLDNLGRLRELEARVPAKIRAAQRAGNRFIEVNYRTQFVSLALAADRPDDARRDVESAIASWPRVDAQFGNQDYLAVRNLTYVALYAGDVEAAVRLLPAWRQYFGSLLARVAFLRQDALTWIGGVALARAACEGAGSAKAKGFLREARWAMRSLEGIALPMAQDGAVHLRAGIAAREGDEDGARAALTEALARAEARGAELNAACVRARLGAIVGGDEGEGMRARSRGWMEAEGVKGGERFVGAILPGI